MLINPNRQISPYPNLNIRGLVVQNDLTTPNTKLVVTPGQCRTQDNTFDISLGQSIVDNVYVGTNTTIDATTNGLNGLDTGDLAASTIYYVYVINSDSTPEAGCVISTRGPDTGPYMTMPGNYTLYRHIGYAITDSSSHFLKFQTAGNENVRTIMYNDLQATAITAGASTSYAAVVLTTLVPNVDNTPVFLQTQFTPAAASDVLTLKQGLTAAGDQLLVTGQVASVVVSTSSMLLSNLVASVQRVLYKVSAGAVNVKVAGFQIFL